jgi:hypothetical protein
MIGNGITSPSSTGHHRGRVSDDADGGHCSRSVRAQVVAWHN